MILVTGSEASGKKTYVRGLGYTEDDMSYDPYSDAPVILNVERAVFEALRAEEEKEEACGKDTVSADKKVELTEKAKINEAARLFEQLKNKKVVTINEVGSGVIPADRAGRLGREASGRLSVLLAKEAEQVIRMVCGIPVVLKEAEESRRSTTLR